MKKLITTNNGGFPVVLDDFRWLQDSWRDELMAAIAQVSKAPTGNYVLFGLDVTDGGTDWDVTEGACVFQGEIYYYEGGSITKVGGQNLFAAPRTGTYDSSGNKTFQDGTTHDTYEIRDLRVYHSGVAPASYITLVNTSATILTKTTWHNYQGECEWIELASGSYQSGYSAGTSPLSYYKRGNMVEIKGAIAKATPATVAAKTHVATLPAGYRPTEDIIMNGYAYASDDYTVWHIEASTGNINVRGDLIGAGFNSTTGITLNGTFACQ